MAELPPEEGSVDFKKKSMGWIEINYKAIIEDYFGKKNYPTKHVDGSVPDKNMLLPVINSGADIEPNQVYKVSKPVFLYRSHYSGEWDSKGSVRIIVSDTKNMQNSCELFNSNTGGNNNHGGVMLPICPGTKAIYVCVWASDTVSGTGIHVIPALSVVNESYGTVGATLSDYWSAVSGETHSSLTLKTGDVAVKRLIEIFR